MTKLRALTFGLLASTALATPAFAQDAQPQTTGQSPAPGTNATDVTAPPPRVQQAQDGNVPDQTEIIITATKREENLQNVPISVQALGTRRLDQLNISNFEDYTKQLPSVTFLTSQPGSTTVYMRGISAAGSGAEGNHSGPLPQVGTYLDEQPVTTIGGTLDVHIYDIARIESLSGPQGTLYGASSEAGTIRIITNKPELGVTSGRIDAQLNHVSHGGVGGSLEGMFNVPIAERIAFRGVAFYQRDAGYIDNIFGSRTYYAFDEDVADLTVTNAGLEKKNFNDLEVWGGRAALKVDLNDNWTATPTFMYQKTKANGVFYYDPQLGDLNIDRFRKEPSRDRFWQAALTVEGKIHNFDVTYAASYMDRPTFGISDYTDYADAYDRLYADYYDGIYGRGLAYFNYLDANGNRTISPQQYIIGTNHFRKLSQELRIASPADRPFRVIAGAFYQRQTNFIHQDYRVDGLAPDLSVNGFPGTLWLTQQKRVDRDYALFGEASWDIVPQVTLTAGGRLFRYDNSLIGFFGFGRNPAFFQGADDNPPPNPANSSRTGVAACFTASGDTLRNSQLNGTDLTLLPAVVSGSPCTNLADFENGKLVPKRAKGHGFTHRLNAQWKPRENLMFYATWSRGFRPGGINRRADVPPYDPDYLTNYEIGWKTTFGPVRWNGAIYHEVWKKFQFAFLGANSFTEIHNGNDARVNGIETDINYVRGGWTVNAAAAYTDAKTKGNICNDGADPDPDCGGEDDFVSAPSGTRLPVTPKFKGSFTTRYSWPAWADVKAHVQGSVSYQSSAPSSIRTLISLVGTGELVNPNVFQGRLRSATLVDLFAGLDFPRWNVELFATNVFDKRNDLSRFTACGSCTRALVVPGRPRTIGVRAGMKF
ncbi:MAG TPA: TonB-dependent receptor [Sphingomicrobium sp.]|nr:TonB-dependent receptor [Sphingomicrobium sp.]